MQYLSQADAQIFNKKKVLVRLDFNVPISDSGVILESDTDRIHRSQKTIDFLKQAGAKIIIISHIGRDPQETLKPVAEYMHITLLEKYDEAVLDQEGIIMLENLRHDPREEKNDETFAKELAAYADYYVNDAFAVCHRQHASVVTVPQLLPSFAGFQLEQEIQAMHQAMHPNHPALLIMGGAKFETKLPVIEQLLPSVDHVIIGGALANNFFKERGLDVGHSLIDTNTHLGDLIHNPKIVISDQLVWQESRIVDILISEEIRTLITQAQTIIWNGPMGNYENSFIQGTKDIAEAIAQTQAVSIVGGGDSIALIQQLGMSEKFTFLSTGGGAMLEYLAQGTLPGIEALK